MRGFRQALRRAAPWPVLAAALLGGVAPRPGAAIVPPDPPGGREAAVGMFLVADPALEDPLFRRTVVVLTRHGRDGSVGVVVNRPSRRLLADIVPGASGGPAPVFIGGPVAPGLLALLVRGERAPPGSTPVAGRVHFMMGTEAVARYLAGDGSTGAVRVYSGYSGWAPGQLAAELAHGAWHLLPADATGIFEIEPALLWEHLMGRIRGRWVNDRPAPAVPGRASLQETVLGLTYPRYSPSDPSPK